MDETEITLAFAALSQPTRLRVFRALMQAAPEGIAAGTLSDMLDVRQNTMSTNLAVLLNAGLIRRERHGRSIYYFADLAGIRALLSYLLQDCCGSRPELCQPVIEALSADGCR
ncbi:ArsR/SmtB family transcription factor [Acuticoccus mangrovi]|uniref:Helix-turn-helix transcriptional regulator n=1 Tax=Acuticoccus mangrovi TaxID=2796142 RepID=A0A934ITH5_9HYPH|nr:metalloregulator ArsR/SmtB family transcription factor [Acuticoccus mangrovi]MBJ3778445.1 helix-turn-helix transcriptional regulator [Acuticoccus mangrovi]